MVKVACTAKLDFNLIFVENKMLKLYVKEHKV